MILLRCHGNHWFWTIRATFMRPLTSAEKANLKLLSGRAATREAAFTAALAARKLVRS